MVQVPSPCHPHPAPHPLRPRHPDDSHTGPSYGSCADIVSTSLSFSTVFRYFLHLLEISYLFALLNNVCLRFAFWSMLVTTIDRWGTRVGAVHMAGLPRRLHSPSPTPADGHQTQYTLTTTSKLAVFSSQTSTKVSTPLCRFLL